MRYIRTKGGIVTNNDTVRTSNIVAKADTIEDLCHAYVVEWVKGMNPTKVRGCYIDISKDCLLALLDQHEWLNAYGAIWVEGEHGEPILKPVAKMNKKGEFELL